jgi:predicted small secreted protein
MKKVLTLFAALSLVVTGCNMIAQGKPSDGVVKATGSAVAPRIAIEKAPAPLYDDPVWHGASDPAVVWLPGKGKHGEYWMYYTQRRATLPSPTGVDWVHGSAIGIATSPDGLHWTYAGVAQGSLKDGEAQKSLGDPVKDNVTWWAPAVFWEKGNGISGGGRPGDKLHMFVTRVHGIFTKWTGTRTIEHFVSDDGVNWTHVSTLPLASLRAIDPTVYKIDGTWFLWYKNEAAGSRTFRATSKDLVAWKDEGDANIGRSHEAPFVWHWKGAFWDLQDNGRALDAWRSKDGLSDWTLNALLLGRDTQGTRRLDLRVGHHPWIVLQDPASGPAMPDNKQLALFYFAGEGKESYMQMAEITLGDDGKLVCDRNKYASSTPKSEASPSGR